MLVYLFAVRNGANPLARIAKNIFPSTFSNDMVQNRLTFLEFLSLVLNIPSASFYASGISPFLQIHLRISRFCKSGHMLYTLYGMALGPGAEPNLAFLITSFTSAWVSSEVSSSVPGGAAGSMHS